MEFSELVILGLAPIGEIYIDGIKDESELCLDFPDEEYGL